MYTHVQILASLLFFKTVSTTSNLRNLNTDGSSVHDDASLSANVPAATPLLNVPTVNKRALKKKSKDTDTPTGAPSGSGSPTRFPCNSFRWILWDDLDKDAQKEAKKLGYNEATWNLPGTALIEDHSWWGVAGLGLDDHATNLGWTSIHWDCWVNHYEDYTWQEIEDWGLDTAFTTLGYDQKKWSKANTYSLHDGVKWANLTEDEKWAADQICYVPDTWESKPLNDWNWTCWEA